MKKICLIDLPGMSRALLEAVPAGTALGRWLAGQRVVGLTPSWPAVTCSVQATLTTGTPPAKHGIIANGLATCRSPQDQTLVDADNFADSRRQVSFWEQSNQFLQSPRFWQDATGRSRFKTALLFFQQSMPGFAGTLRPAADIVLTPKPEHGPGGKIVSLCWSDPPGMVEEISSRLGPFPLMNYWGPMAGLAASRWITGAAEWVWKSHRPQLQLVYVPHLDYDLQRFGPDSPQAIQAVKDVATVLEGLIDTVQVDGGTPLLLSEYAMRPVRSNIYPNRVLASAGLLRCRECQDGKLIDYANSSAWAMVDHQVAHVYARDGRAVDEAADALRGSAAMILRRGELDRLQLDHRRSGDLFLVAPSDAWFDYQWWTDPADAPSFAGMVDIHRKPGYDPLELFWDRAANRIGQDAAMIRGSHGIAESQEAVFIGPGEALPPSAISADQVAARILDMLS